MNQNKTRKVTWTTEKCLDAAMKYSTKEEFKNCCINAKYTGTKNNHYDN